MTLKAWSRGSSTSKRHNPIWPELQASVEEAWCTQLLDLSRYEVATGACLPTLRLSQRSCGNALRARSLVGVGGAYMKDLMLTNEDDSPVTTELSEVFHID